MPRLITVSELKAHRRCRRLHRILYILCYRPAVASAPMRFGTLIHRGLEAWWDGLFDVIQELRTAGLLPANHYDPAMVDANHRARILAAALAAMENEPDPYDRVRAAVMMRLYHNTWINEPLEPVGVEMKLDSAPDVKGVPIVNPWTNEVEQLFRQGGKMDVVVLLHRADGTKGFYGVEHKSASGDISPGSVYRQRLLGDCQVSTYIDGSRYLGMPMEGMIYDMLVKLPMPLKATPTESRKYTVAKYKQCPECKRKPKKDEKKPPPPHRFRTDDPGSNTAGEVTDGTWAECEPGVNEAGEVDEAAPRRICTDPGGQLYANMRAEDETPSEYEARIATEGAERVNEYLARQDIARTDAELDRSRRDTYAEAAAIVLNESGAPGTLLAYAPRNVDACFNFGRRCDFFDVCFGGASLEDPSRFVHVDDPHQELLDP